MSKFLTINFGLVGSTRFSEVARLRVLPENPTAIHGLAVPYIATGVFADFEEVGFKVRKFRIAESSTEPTLVMVVEPPSTLQKSYVKGLLTRIADRYAQDCIAVCDDLGNGSLIGTFSHVWGEFNADYFINY